jgi:hypothetical protein
MEDNLTFEYVNGVNLQQIADVVIDVNRRDRVGDLPDRSIIWCKTDYLDDLFGNLSNNNNRYTLITHCSDHDINEDVFNKRHKSIYKWYAQNANYKHDDLIPLPIGIENHIGPCRGSSIDINFLNNNRDNFKTTNKIISHLYCNFSLQTNSNRSNVYRILQGKQLGCLDVKRPFSEYCQEMKKYLFVASPRGNGIDCHRTWEALYMGCIPIVEKHFMYDSYKHLPIIQIESWENFNMIDVIPYIEKYKNGLAFNNIQELDLGYYLSYIKNTHYV